MRFQDALRKAVNESGLSLRQLADLAGVSYSKAKNYMQGRTEHPGLEEARRLAALFQVSVEAFTAGDFDGTTPLKAPPSEDQQSALLDLWSSLSERDRETALSYLRFLRENEGTRETAAAPEATKKRTRS